MKNRKRINDLPKLKLPRVIPDCVKKILADKECARVETRKVGNFVADLILERRTNMAKKKSGAKGGKAGGKNKGKEKVQVTPPEDLSLGKEDDDGYQTVYSGGTGNEKTFSPEEPGDSCEGIFFDSFDFQRENMNSGEMEENRCWKLLDPENEVIHLVFESHVIKRFFENDPGVDRGQWVRLVYDGKKPTAPGSGRTVKLYTLQFNFAKQEKWADKARKIIMEMNQKFSGADAEVPF